MDTGTISLADYTYYVDEMYKYCSDLLCNRITNDAFEKYTDYAYHNKYSISEISKDDDYDWNMLDKYLLESCNLQLLRHANAKKLIQAIHITIRTTREVMIDPSDKLSFIIILMSSLKNNDFDHESFFKYQIQIHAPQNHVSPPQVS